jgi:predicted RNA-binding Zn ribbon-like protein
VHRLRDAIYEILSALMAGAEPTRDAIATVNAYAAVPVPAPRLIWSGSAPHVVWEPNAGLSGETAMAVLARDLINHLRDPRWLTMLHACAATDCGMIFLDNSQGGRRRWCSMDTCGNRAKAASHRSRYGRS